MTSSGPERRPLIPAPEQRIVHLEWAVAVRPDDLPLVRDYAATHYPAPIPLESAVDDLMENEYPADWWDGCEFEIRDYTFAAVE